MYHVKSSYKLLFIPIRKGFHYIQKLLEDWMSIGYRMGLARRLLCTEYYVQCRIIGRTGFILKGWMTAVYRLGDRCTWRACLNLLSGLLVSDIDLKCHLKCRYIWLRKSLFDKYNPFCQSISTKHRYLVWRSYHSLGVVT